MHLAALTYIRRVQREEERRGAIPGWHGQRIRLHPPYSPPKFEREAEIPFEFGQAGKTHLGRDGPPRPEWSSFKKWVWCNLTNYLLLCPVNANLHFCPFSNP